MNRAEPRLSVRHLTIAYQKEPVLEDLSFDLYDQEFVTLIGPSGVGKSTLLKALMRQLHWAEGDVSFSGEALQRDSRLAYMPQEDLLFPWQSVYGNVTLYQRLHPDQASYSDDEIRALFRRFGLAGYEFALPSELSGGMRQRAAFLRTMLCPADILLLDEPFGALDAITRRQMQDWLLDLRSVLKRSILMVTHDLDEAIFLSDRILLLKGQPAAIRNSYQIATRPEKRDRDWLLTQGKLKDELYHAMAD